MYERCQRATQRCVYQTFETCAGFRPGQLPACCLPDPINREHYKAVGELANRQRQKTTQISLPLWFHCAPQRIKMCMKYSSEFINHKSLSQNRLELDVSLSLSLTRSELLCVALGMGMGMGIKGGHYKCSCLRDNIDKLCKHSHTINKARPTRPAHGPRARKDKAMETRGRQQTGDTRQKRDNIIPMRIWHSGALPKDRIQEVKCRHAVTSRAEAQWDKTEGKVFV